MLAPIAIFAYNRPQHTQRLLESLAANPGAFDTPIYVFIDGPKTPEAAPMVAAVQTCVANFTAFKALKIIASPHNKGLAGSILSGVDRVLSEYSTVIVLEDDLVLSPYFLNYMNEGLRRYAGMPQVASIHGYVYPLKCALPETFFLKGADCWGWGTWRDRWVSWERDPTVLYADLQAADAWGRFDLHGVSPFKKMLEDCIAGKNQSWAIRWHASTFLKDQYTLYPGRSLVQNEGHDGTGVHSFSEKNFDVALSTTPVQVFPQPVNEDPMIVKALYAYFASFKPPLIKRVLRRLKRVFA